MRDQRLTRNRLLTTLALLGFVSLGGQFATIEADPGSRFEFTDRLVAGGPDAAVQVRHLRLRGDNHSIGAKLAETAQLHHQIMPGRLDSLLAGQRLDDYEQHYPMLYQRALGVSEWFGPELQDDSDVTLLPYNLPFSPGCSVVFYPGHQAASGHATLSRNYDFSTRSWDNLLRQGAAADPGCTSRPYVIEMYPDEGYPALYLCSYELLSGCLDGVNSEGLTVALLANEGLPDVQPTGGFRVGLSELEIARFLLDTCATAKEARKALQSAEIYYCLLPCHYIVGDRHGDSFVWEYTTDRKSRFVTDGSGTPQCVTNHSLTRFQQSSAFRKELESSNSLERYNTLLAATGDGVRSTREMVAINGLVRARDPGPSQVRTLWHALYDCEARSLSIDFYLGEGQAQGEPEQRSGYLEFALEAVPSDN